MWSGGVFRQDGKGYRFRAKASGTERWAGQSATGRSASRECVSPREGRWQVCGWAYQFMQVPVIAEAPPRKATSSTPAPRMAPRASFFAGGPKMRGAVTRELNAVTENPVSK